MPRKRRLESRQYWGRHGESPPKSPGRLRGRAAARTKKLLAGRGLSLADRALIAEATAAAPAEDSWEPQAMPVLLRDKYIKRGI